MLRSLLRLGILVLALFALPSRLSANPITFDFDSLAELDAVTTQFVDLSFANATVLTAGSLLNELEFPPRSGANVLFDDGGPIRVDFSIPVSSVGGYFTYGQDLLFQAFAADDTLLGSVSSPFAINELISGDAGSAPNELLQLAYAGIAYVTMTGNPAGGSFTLDDFTYTPAVQPVPEPGTIGLLLLGGCGVLRARRARTKHHPSNV